MQVNNEDKLFKNFTAIVYNFYDRNADYDSLDVFKEKRRQYYIEKGIEPIQLTQNEEKYFNMVWEKALYHIPDMRPIGYSRETRPPTPPQELIDEIHKAFDN